MPRSSSKRSGRSNLDWENTFAGAKPVAATSSEFGYDRNAALGVKPEFWSFFGHGGFDHLLGSLTPCLKGELLNAAAKNMASQS